MPAPAGFPVVAGILTNCVVGTAGKSSFMRSEAMINFLLGPPKLHGLFFEAPTELLQLKPFLLSVVLLRNLCSYKFLWDFRYQLCFFKRRFPIIFRKSKPMHQTPNKSKTSASSKIRLLGLSAFCSILCIFSSMVFLRSNRKSISRKVKNNMGS